MCVRACVRVCVDVGVSEVKIMPGHQYACACVRGWVDVCVCLFVRV